LSICRIRFVFAARKVRFTSMHGESLRARSRVRERMMAEAIRLKFERNYFN